MQLNMIKQVNTYNCRLELRMKQKRAEKEEQAKKVELCVCVRGFRLTDAVTHEWP